MSRRLGQHFLRDKKVLRTIIRGLDPAPGEKIIEIGPGHGQLTQALLATGAEIIALERDADLVLWLGQRFPGLDVRIGDALRLLPAVAPSNGGYKIAGNIPYYITGRLLRILGRLRPLPQSIVLLVQKEVALRAVAQPPHMNRLAAAVQLWSEPEILALVPPESFAPPPEVDSAVIRLIPYPGQSGPPSAERILARLFAQPRKTVLNNLLPKGSLAAKTSLIRRLKAAGINPADRPQDLSLADI